MKKTINSKHIGRVFVYTLLSLFMCMAGAGNANASALVLKPVVNFDYTSYTTFGTNVTLKLWIFNWKLEPLHPKQYNSRFTGDVYLYIDDKEVANLKEMWSLISDANYSMLKYTPGDVGSKLAINYNGTNVGSAQLQYLRDGQTCPYNPYSSEESWVTIELKLSFKNTFSYYGHKFTVKGKWQDQTSGSLVEKDVALELYKDGYFRPINFKVQPSGDKMMFTWEQQGYSKYASTEGKWIVYKRVGSKNVKLGELAATEHSLSIKKKTYSCSNDYIITFIPTVYSRQEPVSGLTAKIPAPGHKLNDDDICQVCGNSYFRYQTTDGNKVDISNKDFGATVVEHWREGDGKSKCVIEFDAPITKIPAQAFSNSNITGNLVIPNSVTEIEDEAFAECKNLNGTLTLSNSLKSIGKFAFCDCIGFTGELTIPNSVTTIGNWAFSGCIGFTGELTIPSSVKTIGIETFYNCTGFTGDLLLHKSLEAVSASSFTNCKNIKTITFQSLPRTSGGYSYLEGKKVSLSDDSYISDRAAGPVGAISYTRTMTSNWGTLVLPYSLTLTGNEPYRLYAIDNMEGEELVLKQFEGEVAAGTPCVVKRNGTESELTFDANDAKLNMARVAQDVGDMTFRGTYWTKDVNSGYVISKNSFWNVEELKGSASVNGVKVRPFRAWLDGTSAKAPARLSMRIDGSTTGIDAIDALNDAEAEYYDLSGKRLDEPQKGVNIVRMKSGKTKKIIIK